MAGSRTAYGEATVQAYLLGATSFTFPTTWYVALSTAAFTTAATGSSMTEVSGGSYARVSLANNTTNFPAPTGSNPSVLSNGTAINFPTATASWGTILSVYLVDASSAGNAWFGADLAAGVVVNSGSSFSIPVGAFVFQDF